jgi:hypothetical protein
MPDTEAVSTVETFQKESPWLWLAVVGVQLQRFQKLEKRDITAVAENL